MPRLTPPPEPNVTEAFGIYVLGTAHRDVRRLRRTGDPIAHGTRTWGASYLLMDFLREHPVRRGATVLEVGCGWAPAGIFCARAFGAKVIGTDLDDKVFPYAEAMARLNEVDITTRRGGFADLGRGDFRGVDTVIGSDICFWNKLVDPLADMVQRAIGAGVKRVLLTDPGRAPFYKMVDRLKARRSLKVTVHEWYAVEPKRYEGDVLEVRRA